MNDSQNLLQEAHPGASKFPGTRSLGRGIKLMRIIAARPRFGWRLSDLAAASELDRATVHRMLTCLVDERLVVQRPSDRHYFPGPLMFELGLALPDQAELQRRAGLSLGAFAQRLGGIAVLLLRSGSEYVCSVRAGSLPLSGSVLVPGARRPLFTAAGGVAILQTLPAPEAKAVLLNNVAQEVARCGASRLASLQRMRERSDRHGFGVNLGDVVPGIHAFGMPVFGAKETAVAALCLLGPPDRFGADQTDRLQAELRAAADALGAEWRLLNP